MPSATREPTRATTALSQSGAVHHLDDIDRNRRHDAPARTIWPPAAIRHPAATRRSAFLVALVLCVSCGACDSELVSPERELRTDRKALIDCTERQDTGYVSGTPFPITVVTVDGKPVERETANAFYVMQQAAASDGVHITIVSGFRTYAEQEYLYNCYINCNCNNCNLAARPGYSNHQSGHAVDLNTSSPGVYDWLEAHAGGFGFSRTVPSEPWHWEWWGGGPGGGPCGGCDPHCEGDLIVDANCGVGDCAAFGSRCVDDNLGVRCAFAFCPDQGTASVCLDEATIGNCDDGALTTGDCSAFAGYCSTAGVAPDQARCVSIFCVESADATPVAHDGCFLEGDLAHCDDNGALTVEPCPAGEVCSVYPTPHCTPNPGCPSSGEASVCLDDTVIGHCNVGSVLEAYDCATESAWCDDSTGEARCVSTACLSAPGATPTVGTVCIDDVTRGQCAANGSVTLEPCPPETVCSDDGGEATCVEARCELQPDGGCTAGGDVFRCSDGVETVETCTDGTQCTIYPSPHCATPDGAECPESGLTRVCIEGGDVLGRCIEGVLDSTVDCSGLGLTCGTVPDGRTACVAPDCVGRAPSDGPFCMESGAVGVCNETGAVEITRCPEGSRCAELPSGAACTMLSQPPAPGQDVAGSDDVDSDVADVLDGVARPTSDQGCCAVVAGGPHRGRDVALFLLMAVAVGLGLARRRRFQRTA